MSSTGFSAAMIDQLVSVSIYDGEELLASTVGRLAVFQVQPDGATAWEFHGSTEPGFIREPEKYSIAVTEYHFD